MSVVVDAEVPEGVTVAGEKLHEAPVGSPEQVNDDRGGEAVLRRYRYRGRAICPAVMVSEEGEAATAKSGVPGAGLTVKLCGTIVAAA